MEDYKKKYKEALENLKKIKAANKDNDKLVDFIEYEYPELKESEDEKIRKELITAIKTAYVDGENRQKWIAWLEKQGKCETDCHHNYQDANYPNGCIVLEDFNGGEGFYKVHLDYLNKKQVGEIEEMIRAWNKDSKVPNENIKSCIGMCLTDACEQRFRDYNTSLKDCLAWLEKQGEQSNKVSIWKHWNNGIAGNGEDKIVYLIKSGNTYMLSSCLGFECDYIELSDLDKLYVEKQGEQKLAWSEEDESMLQNILECLKNGWSKLPTDILKYESWLKCLKERVQPQPKQGWYEEDERIYNVVLELVTSWSKGTIGGCIIPPNTDRYVNWLKSLNERMKGE